MTVQEFYTSLKERFEQVLEEYQIQNGSVDIQCRALSAQEAIGNTVRKDFPIITGKDIMIEARFQNARGQAFTDSPTAYQGTLQEILALDIVSDPHARSLFIAVLNAVMNHLGLCCGTVHCRTEGPELCAKDMLGYLRENHAEYKKVALIGYQPALLEMLSESEFEVRVLDLNPANVGQMRYGVLVEDGKDAYPDIVADDTDLILCTGSTICNGTIVDYIDLEKPVVFFGISLAGAAVLMDLKRACFADRYAKAESN